MSMTYNSKVDRNQGEIVEGLRAVGCSVALTHRFGGGFPDLLVGYYDVVSGDARNLLMEVKVGNSGLNEREREWHEGWIGPVVIVRSIEDALDAIGRIDRSHEGSRRISLVEEEGVK